MTDPQMADPLQCETCGWVGEHTEAQCIDRWGDLFKLIIRAFGPEKVAEMWAGARVLAGKDVGDEPKP